MAELNIMVGGEAGQGVQTVGFILAKTLARAGCFVFSDQDYESRIRGGHNFYRVRASDKKVRAIVEPLDMLVALDQNSIELHKKEVKPGGLIIFDQDKLHIEEVQTSTLKISLEKMALEKGNKILSNSVAVGAAVAAVGFSFDILAQVLRDHFGKTEMGESNVSAAKVGFEHARPDETRIKYYPKQTAISPKMILVDGNQSLSIGAIAAGCKFMAAYPMTPTSSIMETIAEKGRAYNVVVVQPEDEIAAINMVVGAAYAGVRAMTATSGSGFDLMTEGISLAGITETPVVVVLGQRPGPAVGLPTRSDQTELEYAIYTAHGEFPRAVLTPLDIQDCFNAAVKAFNLAEKYQTPVIILTDQYLATSAGTIPEFEIAAVKIERGLLATDIEANSPDYKRHIYTDSGISPRAFPGQGKALVVTDSDEHTEDGHLTEGAETRTLQVSKRLRKMEGLISEITPPIVKVLPNSKAYLVAWGSSYRPLREAADLLSGEGINVSIMGLPQVWPFPVDAMIRFLDVAQDMATFTVEGNATSQLAHLIRAETGIEVSGSILKFDGRPFIPRQIADQIKREVK